LFSSWDGFFSLLYPKRDSISSLTISISTILIQLDATFLLRFTGLEMLYRRGSTQLRPVGSLLNFCILDLEGETVSSRISTSLQGKIFPPSGFLYIPNKESAIVEIFV